MLLCALSLYEKILLFRSDDFVTYMYPETRPRYNNEMYTKAKELDTFLVSTTILIYSAIPLTSLLWKNLWTLTVAGQKTNQNHINPSLLAGTNPAGLNTQLWKTTQTSHTDTHYGRFPRDYRGVCLSPSLALRWRLTSSHFILLQTWGFAARLSLSFSYLRIFRIFPRRGAISSLSPGCRLDALSRVV